MDTEWVAQLDLKEFRREMRELGKELQEGQSQDDVEHLNRVWLWSNAFMAAGVLTLWFPLAYSAVPVCCMAIGITSRWTMIAHHVCHGGYDKDASGRFSRFKFAQGSTYQRFVDWFDWMLPEAWNVEHNHLHHYHLGEVSDPDLVERNLEFLRRSGLPMAFKYSAVAFFVLFWKWFYYSPNTFKELRIRETKKQNEAGAFRRPLTLFDLTLSGPSKPSFVTRLDFLQRVFAPYFVYRFLLFPLPFLLLGEAEFWNAVTNLVLADMLANAYGFLIIVTNHAGDDLYQFDTHCAPKSGRFFVRAVVSSTAFTAGSDLVDFFHGYLNYQVEHHLWPDLSMRSYQKAMPRVKDICRRHGVPYVQENVFRRLKKTVDIMVGTTSQPFFPDHLLQAEDD